MGSCWVDIRQVQKRYDHMLGGSWDVATNPYQATEGEYK